MKVSEVEFLSLKKRDLTPSLCRSPQSKYHAVISECDGIKFRSKKERKRYLELMALRHAGEVKYFLMQVPFRLPGNTKYLLDFMVFWKNGEVTYEDAKGVRTAMYIMKKKQVQALYPVTILES